MSDTVAPAAGTRGSWGSHLGFILASAGAAVGLGNIWRFPYLTGENGGGAFLIIYLALTFTVAISVLLAEFVVGRAAQHNPVGAYRALGGGLWPIFGVLGVAAAFVILSFYSVVGGWTVAYLIRSIGIGFPSSDPADLGPAFGGLIGHPIWPILCHAVFMALTVGIAIGGVRAGIERWCRLLMPILFVLVLILVVRSVTLPGAGAGIAFFLVPDFARISGEMFLAALSQALFSVAVGVGAMLTYASYLSRSVNLPSATGWIVTLDLIVALLAGLIILPAVFAFGFDPASGPPLTYITLPAVFAEMPAGQMFGTLFFLLLLIAAVTSAINLFEVVLAFMVDELGVRRTSAALIGGTLIFAVGIPSAYSFGIWEEVRFAGRNFFDWMDFLTTNLALPIGAFAIAVFTGWAFGNRAIDEATSGGLYRFGLATAWLWVCRVVAPAAIVLILLSGLGLLGG